MNKRLLLTIFILLTGFVSQAQYTVQSKYFVYLQTEPAQPFYIKISGERISANSSGYLIMPQLKDGDYKLVVGFPDNKYPELTFNFKIDSKDKGYLIKNFGADGWSLFDLQTMAVQKPLNAEETAALAKAEAQKRQPPPVPKKETVPADNVSDFTKVLSKAANDPSLLEKPKPEEKPIVKEAPPIVKEEKGTNEAIPAKEPEKPAIQEAVVAGDGEKANEIEMPAEEVAQPAGKRSKKAKSSVVKLSQHDSDNGTIVLYEDRSADGGNEQIEITIPATDEQAETAASAVPEQQPVPTAANKDSEKKQSEKFVVEEKPAIQPENIDNESGKINASENPIAIGCKTVASEDDFLGLRRTMASEDNDDKMISQAKKAFKNKCYTTAQIKYISSMFLSNAGKYNFYEAAIGHVADPENFSSLGDEIKDSYYQEKFNALVK